MFATSGDINNCFLTNESPVLPPLPAVSGLHPPPTGAPASFDVDSVFTSSSPSWLSFGAQLIAHRGFFGDFVFHA